MPWIVGGAILGGSLLGGLFGADSADKAGDAQVTASREANAEARRQFDLQLAEQKRQYDTQRGDLRPYRELGYDTLPTLKGAYGLGTEQENAAALDRFRTATPDYQFGFDEGNRALQGQLQNGMGRFGGGALKATQRYGQNYAMGRYGDWRQGLSGPAGFGSSAVGQGNQASQNYANSYSNASQNYANMYGQNTRAAGDARASAYIGQGQAWGGAVDNALTMGAYGYGKGWFG